MKLLEWMNRMLRQNSVDVLREFAGGGTFLLTPALHQIISKMSMRVQDIHCRAPGPKLGCACNCLSGRRLADEAEEDSCRWSRFPAMSPRHLPDNLVAFGVGGDGGDPPVEELLCSLLAIGTLGIAPQPNLDENSTEMAAPGGFEENPMESSAALANPPAIDAIAGKKPESEMGTKLMAVGAELEKAMVAVAKEGVSSATVSTWSSSVLPSYLSAPGDSTAFPIQGNLFRSPIGQAEMTTEEEVGRAKRRPSLGELLIRSRGAEEGGGENTAEGLERAPVFDGGFGDGSGGEGGGGQSKAAKAASAVRTLGKMTRILNTLETKFHKALQIFPAKVHPENGIMTKKHPNEVKNAVKDHLPLTEAHDRSGKAGGVNTNASIIPSYDCCLNSPPHVSLSINDPNCGREHWINTDEDYLVLEL